MGNVLSKVVDKVAGREMKKCKNCGMNRYHYDTRTCFNCNADKATLKRYVELMQVASKGSLANAYEKVGINIDVKGATCPVLAFPGTLRFYAKLPSGQLVRVGT